MNLWLVRQVHHTHTVTVLERTTHAPTRTALRADCNGGSLLPRLIPRYLHLTQHLPRSVQFVGASTPCSVPERSWIHALRPATAFALAPCM